MLYTSKIILKIAVFLTVIIAAVNFISCGDDIVYVAKEEFDPPRFNWRSMEVPNMGYSDVWALDTSNIYMINYYDRNLYKISNGNISVSYVGYYGLNQMQGVSNNEIYIFGGAADGILTIIKWDGTGFSYYPTNINLSGNAGYWIKGYVRNSNEIWICSQNGIAIFNGINYQYYTFDDTTMTPNEIFLSENNTIQYICQKEDAGGIKQSLYELQGNTFIKLFEYYKDPNINMSYIFLKEINGNKFGIEIKQPAGANWGMCYYDFNNYTFSSNYCFNNKIYTLPFGVRSINPAGANLNNYIMFIESESSFFEHYRTGIIHWNGNIFSKEFGLSGAGFLFYEAYILSNIHETSYLILEPHIADGKSTLYIGTKK